MSNKCPGQDTRYWTPDDVSERNCPDCGSEVEFFKMDLVQKCPQCKRTLVNPKFNLGCAEWCASASECLGTLASTLSNVAALRKSAESVVRQILEPPEVKHVLKVTETAEAIGREEKGNPLLIILSGLLHALSREKWETVLARLNLPKEIVDEITKVLTILEYGGEGHPVANILWDAQVLAADDLVISQASASGDGGLRTESGRNLYRSRHHDRQRKHGER